MAFQRPTLTEIVERIAADFKARLGLTGAILRRSVVYVKARVFGGAVHMLYGYLDFLARQIFPDQSEAEYLERQASLYGITRLPAVFASGIATATGSNGATIPAETILQSADGLNFRVTEARTISAGTAALPIVAQAAGAASNLPTDAILTFASPIAGVNATAPVASPGIATGADTETDDALRLRVLERMRRPPHGGADFDYKAWAKEASPAVTRVWVYPLEQGGASVVVRFVTDNLESIIPGEDLIALVLAYIEARRPVTAEIYVVAPIAEPLDFEINVSPNTPAVRAAIEAELRDLIAREGEPGAPLLISHIREAVSVAAGEYDHELVSPSANVTHTAGKIPVMGTITWADL